MENRHEKVSTEVNARFIDESQILTPLFERTYTIEEDGKSYAVLHLDFEEKQITQW